jgi:hypothetical protein
MGAPVTAATPDEVRATFRANPNRLHHSGGDDWHQYQWERAKKEAGTPTKETAPIAFHLEGGFIRVHDVRWLAVGEIAEITPASQLARAAPAAAPGKVQSQLAFAKTPAPGDPGMTPGTPAPRMAPRPGRVGAAPPPVAPGGYQAVPRQVVAEAYQLNPDSIVRSDSHDFHKLVWGRNKGEPPLAFRVGEKIRVDIERWPIDRLDEIGLAMRLPEKTK